MIHVWVIPPSLFDDSDMDPQYAVSRLWPEPCGWLFLSDGSLWNETVQMFIMETPDTERPLPDPFLLRTHHRIAAILHLFHVEEKIAEGWPSPSLCMKYSCPASRTLRTDLATSDSSPQYNGTKNITLSVAFGTECYRLLLKLGSHLYPRSFTGLVHRLPLGLYAKGCNRSGRNEADSLRLVEQYTSIPCPLWVDDYHETHPILIMTAVPGQPLEKVFHRLSYPERDQLSKDLKNIVTQLRCIPNQTSYCFGNSHGGPLTDPRLPSGTCGPFNLISEFNSFLVHRYMSKETRDNIATVHARPYRSLFTHADLHPSNIIMDRGRLAGIVDWECAGFYREYWEFTKLIYGAERSPEIRDIIRDSFTDNCYEEELEAERLLWYDTPFGI
ncbi:hypothetical protein N7512_005728 [Penicillium capsulatum]|nr:hypothetical protein N7512_005728 [Penicillium capsulatum]